MEELTVRLSDLPGANPLSGIELVPMVQNGSTVTRSVQDLVSEGGLQAHIDAPDPHPQYAFRVKNNLTATTNPTVNDDSSQGYEPTSRWVNTVTEEFFICVTDTVGAANWQTLTLTLDELGSAALADVGTSSSELPTNQDVLNTINSFGIGTVNPEPLTSQAAVDSKIVNGVYYVSNVQIVTGEATYGSLLVLSNAATRTTQTFRPLISTTSEFKEFHRYSLDGGTTWSAWVETYHTGNDGAGSGLDADTLDGLDSTQFLRSDQSDTMTGTLNVNGTVNASTSANSWAFNGTSNGSNNSGLWFSGDTAQILLRNSVGGLGTTISAGSGSTIAGVLNAGSFSGEKIELRENWNDTVITSNAIYNQENGRGFAIGNGTSVSSWFGYDGSVHRSIDVLNNGTGVTIYPQLTLQNGVSGDGSGLTNVNATTLDTLDSTAFLRSNATDVATGQITFTRASSSMRFEDAAGSARLYFDGSDGDFSGADYAWIDVANNGDMSFFSYGSQFEFNKITQVKGGSAYVSLSVARDSQFSAGVENRALLDVETGTGHARLISLEGGVTKNILEVRRDGSLYGGPSGTSLIMNSSGAINANTLNGFSSGSFIRSDADDTASGWYTFSNSNGLETRYGIQGGYGDSNGSGTDWGVNIWAMGNAYMGTGAGTSFSPGGYQLAWIRSAGAGYNGNIGEGLHIFSQNALVGGIGANGMYTTGALVVGSDLFVSSRINHTGNTSTYMQFHSTDQWRVVTNNVERLEVNNTNVTISGANLVIPDGTVGSNATRDAIIQTTEPTSGQGVDGDICYVYTP